MYANGYVPEGEYFARILPTQSDGSPRFMMHSLSIEDPANFGKFIADCVSWQFKEFDLSDENSNSLPTGWNELSKHSGHWDDNALRLVCR